MERLYRASFAQSPVAEVLVDLTTDKIADANDAFTRLVGYMREELIGNNIAAMGIARADSYAAVYEELRVHKHAREVHTNVRRKNGEVVDVTLDICVVDIDGRPFSVAALVDHSAERKLEAELHQAQKLESLGRLAGGIAHDFNNLLAVIATNASMLGELIADSSDAHEMVADLEHAVQRASQLTRQLLAFSRKQVIAPIVLDVNAIVADTRKMLRRMIGEDIELETSFEPELRHVRIDPGQLVQVLMNLAVNARDAMPRGGRLVIATRNDHDHVALLVSDNGCGMTPEVRERVFEPFFTTKEPGKGTGMGLAVVHGIIDQAGGKIELETTPGAGTLFHILLPAVDEPLEFVINSRHRIPRGHETVLVVDDDSHVRRAAMLALRSNGYRTYEASDGRAALGLLQGTPIDLLLTDVVMAGMDGRELAEAARSSRPDLKVLYMTGYCDDVRFDGPIIEKPFRVLALATKVRQVLDRAC